MEGSNFFSNDLPVFLSHRTSLPEGHIMASSIAVCLASGLSESFMSFLMPPDLRQNLE